MSLFYQETTDSRYIMVLHNIAGLVVNYGISNTIVLEIP